uniref:Predicted protein n=1 Tax=Hordeum vulgare subsp. vulgare TaxID=112509 RepID=F2DAB3_HORVV|nr:predicted protein [Hordeum vulgare subsp. vulgare]
MLHDVVRLHLILDASFVIVTYLGGLQCALVLVHFKVYNSDACYTNMSHRQWCPRYGVQYHFSLLCLCFYLFFGLIQNADRYALTKRYSEYCERWAKPEYICVSVDEE